MKKTFISFACIAMFSMAALVSEVASAQTLKISTGGPGATYSRMVKELSNVCSTQIPLIEMNSSGSTQNIDRLTGNEVNAAIVQTDVLFYRAQNEDLKDIKTLVSFHPEEIHLVTLTESKEKSGGTLGFGAKTVELNTVGDLAGRVVAAAGGSYVTAQVIRLQTEINFTVLEVANAEEALKAVSMGKASAALLVGGQPLGQVAALDRNFKLMNFPEAVVAKLKNVYSPAKLNYSKINAKGVSTISTNALFVVRNYKSPKFVEGINKLRECIVTNVPEMAETTGLHAAWSKVDLNNQGKWAYYNSGK